MTRLTQAEVEEGCMAAYERYAALHHRAASLAFSFELQGFANYLVGAGLTLAQVRVRIEDLLDLLDKANT